MRSGPLAVLFGLASALGAAPNASAQQQEPRQPPPHLVPSGQMPATPPAEPREWYGWQIIAVDLGAAALGLGIASSSLRNEAKEVPSIAGVVVSTVYTVGTFAPAAVHFAHGRPSIGFADFGVRTIVPPIIGAFSMVGGCTGSGRFNHSCVNAGFTFGMVLGVIGTSVVDAVVLSERGTGERSGPRGDWYGWQTLAADALGLGLGIYFAAIPKKPDAPEDPEKNTLQAGLPLYLATGMYTVGIFGPPIIHFAHGRIGIGFADLGIRMVAPAVYIVFGMMGYCAGSGAVKECGNVGIQTGFLAGTLAVAAVDAFVLAYEKPDPNAPPAAKTTAPTWLTRLAPSLTPLPGGGGLVGVGATF